MYCVCGRELTSTAASCWETSTIDSQGKVISGTCIHGKYFPPVKEGKMIQDERYKFPNAPMDDWINVGKFDDFLTGKKQLIIYANTSQMVWHMGVIN